MKEIIAKYVLHHRSFSFNIYIFNDNKSFISVWNNVIHESIFSG